MIYFTMLLDTVLAKYGDADIIKYHESVISLFDAKKTKREGRKRSKAKY